MFSSHFNFSHRRLTRESLGILGEVIVVNILSAAFSNARFSGRVVVAGV